jgi:protocatechuate 3,4-dioxygenase, beta subunit
MFRIVVQSNIHQRQERINLLEKYWPPKLTLYAWVNDRELRLIRKEFSMASNIQQARRQLLRCSAATSIAFFTNPGLFAEELMRTPSLTEGPFYPDRLPLDQDNDLVVIRDGTTPAVGVITHLTGRILTSAGSPVRGVTMEIWQCDANAVYLHTRDSKSKKDQQDRFFQGFGKFETGSTGEYRFRTIKPVPYPGRPAPHIHIKIKKGDRELLTTQLMIRGHAGNVRDGIFSSAGNLILQELVMGDFVPVKDSKIGEYACNFDIVLGKTPDDRELTSQR